MARIGEQVAKPIQLHLITASHNPRKPLKKLQSLGFDPLAFCHEYGLSDDEDKRKHFVETIRENHPEIEFMAGSLDDRGQIQAITVRAFRTKIGDEQHTHYGIACGERRYISCVFQQALSGEPFPVRAVVKEMTVQQAYWMGVEENLIREDMTELEKGEIFHKYAEEYTLGEVEEDGKQRHVKREEGQPPLPMTEVAAHFHVPYHYARGRAALVNLKPERLAAYEDGKLNLTDAIRESLGEQQEATSRPSRRGTRQNPLTMSKIRALFDATPRTRLERLQAFAEVMQMSLENAVMESDVRLSEVETKEARSTEREERRRTA